MKTGDASKARVNAPVSDDDLARYTASRAFLIAQFVGGFLMLGSFALLYVFTFGPKHLAARPLTLVSLGVFVVGSTIWWQARKIWNNLDYPYRKGLQQVSLIIAGSGAFFWLLFALLLILQALGVAILPE